MVLNNKAWVLVQECDFIAARRFFDAGVTYQPGEDFPNVGKNMKALYDTQRITVKQTDAEIDADVQPERSKVIKKNLKSKEKK
jgi:hypothetical protein